MMTIWILLSGVMLAVFFDWKTRRIPNWLTAAMTASGFILSFYFDGFPGLWQSVSGFACGILLLLAPFAAGGVGGGDVKLMGAVGSFAGPLFLVQIFLASAFFGGLMSLAVMVQKKAVWTTVKGIKDRVLYLALTRKLPDEDRWKTSGERIRIPYALAIGCGCFLIALSMGG